jgi:hypothetical protein
MSLCEEFDDMLGINEHSVIVTEEFAAAVRKAAKASVIANSKQVSPKNDSGEKKYHFDWK